MKIDKRWTFVIGLILVGMASVNLWRGFYDYKKASDFYELTRKQYATVSTSEEQTQEETSESADSQVEDAEDWDGLIEIDFQSLNKINSEIIGWIFFEDGEISYPILYSGDNSKYLRMMYDGKSSSAGSIFLDGRNHSDFEDRHLIIYGHNMKDLTMFGTLKYYRSKENYINEHRYFQIITQDRKYRYEIQDYQVVNADAGIYSLSDRAESDRYVVTLSTCSGETDRLVVNAVRIDERYLDSLGDYQ